MPHDDKKKNFRGKNSPPEGVTNHANVTMKHSPSPEEQESRILRPAEHERRIHDF